MALRFELSLIVEQEGNLTLNVHAPDVTGREVAGHLLRAALQLMAQERLPTRTEVEERVRRARAARDYPAVRYHPPTQALLCAACVDLVADAGLLEGPVVPLPPGTAAGCTYHLENQWPGGRTLEELSALRAEQTPNDDVS